MRAFGALRANSVIERRLETCVAVAATRAVANDLLREPPLLRDARHYLTTGQIRRPHVVGGLRGRRFLFHGLGAL